MLYVHPKYQHKGVASLLCDKLEEHVKNKVITVDASITAKPFFLKRGYEVIMEQTVVRQGVVLTNYRMGKEKRKLINLDKKVNFKTNIHVYYQ